MTRISPADAANKWAQRLGASTQDMARGIDNTTVSPMQKAASSSSKWLAKVTQSEEKFRRNVGAVTLESWKAAAKDGVGRVAAGANSKKGKMQAFQEEFFQHLDRGAAAINAMQTNTVEDGIAKAAAQIRHNANFKRSGTR